MYRLVQKKGTVLQSTSQAQPGRTFSQPGTISFAQPCVQRTAPAIFFFSNCNQNWIPNHNEVGSVTPDKGYRIRIVAPLVGYLHHNVPPALLPLLACSLSLFPTVENEKKEMGQCDDDDDNDVNAMGDPMS